MTADPTNHFCVSMIIVILNEVKDLSRSWIPRAALSE